MFTDKFTPLHIAKTALRTEEREKGQRFPVVAVGLVLEPLTYEKAKQLGADILRHCFTDKKAIRSEMSDITIALDQPEQCLTARMAEDVEAHCQLRQVRIRKLKIVKRDAADGGTKSKKIGPQQPTLRATFECLMDAADTTVREFLCGFFGQTFYFSFDPEQTNLFTGVYTDDGDEDDEDQGELDMAPAPDADAGDVLDEQKPRLVKGRKKKNVNGSGAEAEA